MARRPRILTHMRHLLTMVIYRCLIPRSAMKYGIYIKKRVSFVVPVHALPLRIMGIITISSYGDGFSFAFLRNSPKDVNSYLISLGLSISDVKFRFYYVYCPP